MTDLYANISMGHENDWNTLERKIKIIYIQVLTLLQVLVQMEQSFIIELQKIQIEK